MIYSCTEMYIVHTSIRIHTGYLQTSANLMKPVLDGSPYVGGMWNVGCMGAFPSSTPQQLHGHLLGARVGLEMRLGKQLLNAHCTVKWACLHLLVFRDYALVRDWTTNWIIVWCLNWFYRYLTEEIPCKMIIPAWQNLGNSAYTIGNWELH